MQKIQKTLFSPARERFQGVAYASKKPLGLEYFLKPLETSTEFTRETAGSPQFFDFPDFVIFSPDVTLGEKCSISPLPAGRLCSGLFRCEARPTTEKDPLKSLKHRPTQTVKLAGGRAARLSHDVVSLVEKKVER